MLDADELAKIRAHCNLLHAAARAGRLAQLGRHDAYAFKSRCVICRSEPGEERGNLEEQLRHELREAARAGLQDEPQHRNRQKAALMQSDRKKRYASYPDNDVAER